jgi:cytochrome c
VTTAALAGTMGQNGWYTSDVTVTLSATDPPTTFQIGGSTSPFGVNHTYYKIDSGSWNTYTSPFVITAAGQHTVLYYSVDIAGNVETQKSVSLKIDKTAPTITLTKEQIDTFDAKFTAQVSDETSGVDRVEFSLDGVLQFTDTQSPYEWTWTGFVEQTLTATVFDKAGNSKSQSMSTPVDQIQGINTIQSQMMQQLIGMILRKQSLT